MRKYNSHNLAAEKAFSSTKTVNSLLRLHGNVFSHFIVLYMRVNYTMWICANMR